MAGGTHPRIIRVAGGCAEHNDRIAEVGGREFTRGDDESVAVFEARVIALAESTGAEVVILGGIDPEPAWLALMQESAGSAEAAAEHLAHQILTNEGSTDVRLYGALRGWVAFAKGSGAFTPSARQVAALDRLPPDADLLAWNAREARMAAVRETVEGVQEE